MRRRKNEVVFEEVVFERVEDAPPRPRAKPQAARSGAPARDRFDTPTYPLVGPILERADPHVVRGVCGRCQTRLRVRVRGRGAVRVACPVCGHARRVEF